MIDFECDYNCGAHPLIIENLVRTNETKSRTYGFDEWSYSAKEKIKQAANNNDLDIFFLNGGTQTNATVIDSLLKSYEGVVTNDCGHINVHEAGAIEAFGHKVIALSSHNGKLNKKTLENFLDEFHNDESKDHVAQPGMVYITFPTEFGTIYSKKEIEDIYSICRQNDLPLYIDGARLGYGLMSDECDFDLSWLTHHCDCFYIGGTKCGALCGEAVVFTHNNAPKGFFSNIKRHGALNAKSRLIGVQFDTLFTDNLYFDISKNAIDMAKRLKSILQQAGFKFYISSPTNQQFVIIPNEKVKKLESKMVFTHWFPFDADNFVCRFVTSWATTKEEMDELEKILLN